MTAFRSLTLDLGQETDIDTVLLQENIALGQRVRRFSIQAWNGSEFAAVSSGTTIGYKRIVRFQKVRTSKIRVAIEDARACPVISTFALFDAGG